MSHDLEPGEQKNRLWIPDGRERRAHYELSERTEAGLRYDIVHKRQPADAFDQPRSPLRHLAGSKTARGVRNKQPLG